MSQNKHLIFVYGTLKEGYGNNHLLRTGGAKKIANARTEKKYTLMDFGGFPGMYNHGENVCVTGELWEVDDATLARCDLLEGHPSFYKRTPIHVKGSDRDNDFITWFCETYFYQGPIRGAVCVDGIWPISLANRRKSEVVKM